MSYSIIPQARILVIDDEPSNVRLLERMLDLFGGLQYKSTIDSREAVPLFAEFQPDLVLTDLHMPHLDGYQVIEQLRQLITEDRFLPIVVLTADITTDTRRKALASGASDFITKPLDTTEVQLRIRNLLENRFLNLKLEEQVQQRTQELEHALEQLRATQEQVVKQERLRALGMMAGGIAHDFNNALTMILGYGELLLPWVTKVAPDSREQAYMTHIVSAAHDATQVVSRLRDFYRPAELNEMRTYLDLGTLCRQVADFTAPKWRVKAQATGAQIEFNMDLAENVGILGNAAELREVLTNLIFNAVDAMPQGGSISMRTRVLEDRVRLDLIDTGIGMSPDEMAQCLEPFFTTKGERGTGLGLSVTYGIVQRHGGTIEIDSEKGRGTTFSLFFPRAEHDASSATTPEVDRLDRALRVLVVDDQEIICELIGEYLTADGHAVTLYSDALVALGSITSSTFDLLITDQSMPGMSGEQLARSARERSPGIRTILLTGFGQELQATGILPEGIDRILGKPVSASDLRRAIYETMRD